MVMKGNVTTIRKVLKKKLDEDRYEHTLGVAYTAMCLAMKYGEDLYKAEVAGLLHDCAKCYPDEVKLAKCEKYNISVTDVERRNPSLVHAKLGAFLAMNKYGVTDMDVVDAILNHTTGKPAMTLLEKIIFVAEYIEPRRNKAPHLDKIRRLAFEDLDGAVRVILKATLEYLQDKGSAIDEMTAHAWEYYEKEWEKERKNESVTEHGEAGI